MIRGKPVKVYADFQNSDSDGFVRLNTNGTEADLKQLDLQLTEGLELLLSDGDVQTVGIVRQPGIEQVWRASIDWKALLNCSLSNE